MCSACSPAGGSDRPLVIATTNIVGDLVRNVVGDTAEVRVLMPRNADPHSFEISASDAAQVERADLVVANGLGLEEGLGNTVDAARDEGVPVVELAPAVDPIPFAAGASAGAQDPHFWTDPDRVSRAVDLIRDAVVADVVAGPDETAAESGDAAVVRANAEGYRARLVELTTFMQDRFDALEPGSRRLVTNHHVFGYLAQRFGFDVVGAVVPSGTTLASPSASDLSDLATTIRDTGVRAIFVDSSRPDQLARALASEAGTPVTVTALHTESLGDEGSDAGTYLDMMRTNAELIATGLGS
ncbi:zinc ABC transporter substrate-binding protein AztC [Rhodococcus sp. HNM0569]|uniref:zinc ABC transporter substrate-binding protein AztC n=1 Tax=Rhodococcus sp. HNM0569 TaxID=2716340 RepID=UPI001F0D1317|nr:zinc ABC transporter substrate-binding protein AztC [Rhodococcus sp. HNM0569]